MIQSFTAVLASLILSYTVTASLHAAEYKVKDLVIEHPNAMATAPRQPHGAVYFNSILNKGAHPDQLIGGRTMRAKSVEVHRMEMTNNVMKMREIIAIELPANARVTLRRGNKEGYHLMLMGLKAPLKEGETFPMTLIFKNSGEVEVTVTIEKPTMPMHGGHKH